MSKDCKIVCVDIDGTIADYAKGYQGPGIFGPPIEGVQDALQTLHNMNWKIIIFTCRGIDELDALRYYLRSNNIVYDKINEDIAPGTKSSNPGKPHADVYVDDRGLTFNGNWAEALIQILSFQPWHKLQWEQENKRGTLSND